MGLGPIEPCAQLGQHPASPWGLGRQRVDPGLWLGGHCLAAKGSGSDTSSGLRTQLLCECSAPHRCHSLTHTHTRGLGHSFCMRAWHHRRPTQTHTHTLHSSAHTFRHTHGSGHSFCVSAWHHRRHTQTHTHTHTRLRTQLLRECLAPHRCHTQTYTHSSQQRTLTFRLLGEPRQVGHREASPPAPPPTLSANSAAEPEALRTRLLDDVTVHTPGDARPTGPGGRPLESSTEQDSCHRMRVTAAPSLRWDCGWQRGRPGLSLLPLPRLDTVHLEPKPGLRSSAPRGWCVWPWGGGSRPAPWPPSRKSGVLKGPALAEPALLRGWLAT